MNLLIFRHSYNLHHIFAKLGIFNLAVTEGAQLKREQCQ